MSKKITILFSLLSFVSLSQTLKLARYEWLWAIGHPVAAFKVNKITKKCRVAVDPKQVSLQLDSFISGGKADAFRHTFFMAAYAQKIKVTKLRKLGRAHEKANYRQFLRSKNEYGELPDSLATVMDLNNNELGFQLGSENTGLSLQELSRLVITEIKNGKAWIMRRNIHGAYLDCSNKIIDLQHYAKRWSVPKCLVNSNMTYK
jgi:hypothetical protein